ncbi:MAG: hypothetical protein IPI55_07340 [Flavobacteriales bacterium]|nr:hypothetical protein [Flavobacteriales bacterium]
MSTKHIDHEQTKMAKQRWQGTRHWLLLLSTIGLAIQVCGQPTTKLDSLIAQLHTTRRDTVELTRLDEVSELLWRTHGAYPTCSGTGLWWKSCSDPAYRL